MKSLMTLIVSACLAGSVGGCAVRGGADVYASSPELVYVQPGVYVIADYPEPVFYSEGYYWRYDGGIWLRSQFHDRGWARMGHVPAPIARIDRPQTYVHYRPGHRASTPMTRAPEQPPEQRVAPPHERHVNLPPGQEMHDHGQSGDEHGQAGEDHGQAGEDHGQAAEPHGQPEQKPDDADAEHGEGHHHHHGKGNDKNDKNDQDDDHHKDHKGHP